MIVVTDCMEWLSLRKNNFDILMLISGDSDFMPLVEQFMCHGKDVIIGAVKKTGISKIMNTSTGAFFIDDILHDELEISKDHRIPQ
jgi:uncharacterized LabA/DUF88 family protein